MRGTRLLHLLLAESARRYPDRPAIVDGDRVISYRDLDEWSNQVARALIDEAVEPGDRVGILLEKSVEAVAAIYGVMKAGACYVPCDPQAPVSRLLAIATDCGMRVLCTAADRRQTWQHLTAPPSAIRRVLLIAGDAPDGQRPHTDTDPRAHTAEVVTVGADSQATAPHVPVTPDDLAYLLYTSGSTGQPKGVMLSHRNGLAFVDWIVTELGITERDRLSSHAPFHFDLSIMDLFAGAAAGAATCLVPTTAAIFPARLATFIGAARITIWYSVPSVLNLLTQRGGLRVGDLPDLRAVLFAGEVFPTRHLRRLMELLPTARFGNLYGPTETNVCTAHWLTAPPTDDNDVPIGSPITGIATFLTTEDGPYPPARAVTQTGEAVGDAGQGTTAHEPDTGELWVSGPTVARGYWGDPERTAQRFCLDPRGTGAVAYRTGDIVRRLPGGGYQFLGRRDNQIKSRGYRIELDEIESVLRRLPGVLEVALVAVPDAMVTNLIKACAVVTPAVTTRDLHQHCQRYLPKPMIPDVFELLDELPKTSTGKIDRRSLTWASDSATQQASGIGAA